MLMDGKLVSRKPKPAHISFFDQISKNKRESIALISLILGVLYLFVYMVARIYDPSLTFVLLSIAIIITVVHTTLSYYKGADIVLKSTGAYPADPKKKKYLYYHNVVEGLAIAAGIPKPKLYVLPSEEINAFASGRDPKHAVIAVTEGALDKLNRQELEGVIAHEISHIGNYDIRFSMLVAVFVGLVAILSEMFLRSLWFGDERRDRKGGGLLIVAGIVLAILAPIVARLVQLAISRRREFLADATGAKITRYPEGLASALEKIKKYNEGNMKVSEAVSHIFLSDPKKSFVDNIFATHPPLDERIRILRSM